MKIIYIVGGDGFARECYMRLRTLPCYGAEIKFGGFLGHGGYGASVDYKSFQHLYIGEVSEHQFSEDEYAIIGAAYPKLRKKIYLELKARGIKFFNLISPYVSIDPSSEIGECNVIVGTGSISVNCKIGNANVLNGNVIVGHDCIIGDLNFLGPRAMILGNIKIGNENQIGTNAILLPKSHIGNNNIIAPMSAIYKGCKNNCYMAGNPALKEGSTEN